MAIGSTIVKTAGRIIFDLERDEEVTSRSIEVPFPYTSSTSTEVQNAVNEANAIYTSTTNAMNIFIQPANWRDNNDTEEQWVTKGVRYELVETYTTPVTPETPVTLVSAQESQEQG